MTDECMAIIEGLIKSLREERKERQEEVSCLRDRVKMMDALSNALTTAEKERDDARRKLFGACMVFNNLPKYSTRTAKEVRDAFEDIQAKASKFVKDYDVVIAPENMAK